MNLNDITNTGTWGQQVTSLNQNFNRLGLGYDNLTDAYYELAEQYEDLIEAYSGVTKADIEIVTTLPANGQANKIYRKYDQDHTPPQFYEDYMYNKNALTTPILLARYTNSLDSIPTKNSLNLVTSGGVYLKQIILSNPISDITTIL